MSILKIKDLVHKYVTYGDTEEDKQEIAAINHIDINVEKGEFVAILGKNGSGKSSLAKHINGLLMPTEGTVYIKGMDTKGQKQRVAIAGIMAMEPECIVLDEPTAMLDPEGRRHVLSLVKALNKEKNITILMVTHHMEEVILADRIIVMDQGKIVMDGKPKEIFSRVDEMKTLGLEVPYATELAWELKKEGVNLSDTITTKEELVEELCQFV